MSDTLENISLSDLKRLRNVLTDIISKSEPAPSKRRSIRQDFEEQISTGSVRKPNYLKKKK